MFTVTFLNANSGNWEVSRYFQSRRAAQKWVGWLLTQKWVARTCLYRGPAGGDLLEEAGR